MGEMQADSIGVWRRGGSTGEKEGRRGAGEKDREVRTGNAGQSGGGRVECFTRRHLCPVASGRGRLLLVLLLRQPPASGGVRV